MCSYMSWECDSISSKHHRSVSRHLNYAASLPGEMVSSKMICVFYQCIETIYSSSIICEWPVSALVWPCYHYTACQNDWSPSRLELFASSSDCRSHRGTYWLLLSDHAHFDRSLWAASSTPLTSTSVPSVHPWPAFARSPGMSLLQSNFHT